MDFLKSLFNNGSLSWDEFSAAVNEKGYKLADLSTGKYVSKGKYDDDIQSRESTITDLNTQISTRDTDITNLKTQLEQAGTDSNAALADMKTQLETLQNNYTQAKTDYEARLQAQSYEFAVKDYANSQKFSSNAAKRDFINEMLSAGLKMNENKIMGADDFAKSYMEANSDAFAKDEPAPKDDDPKPMFGQPTPPAGTPAPSNAFANAFNFQGVRAH